MTTAEYYSLERSITYPSHDIPMLRWWEGVYDHVFVALHPFFRVPGYSPRSAAWGPAHLEWSDVKDINHLINGPGKPNPAPGDFDEIIKRTGRPVLWSHVNEAIGNHPFNDFCLAAWMATVEFRRKDSNENLISQILDFSNQTDLYFPEEDRFPAILEAAAGEAFERCEIYSVFTDDEFDENLAQIATSTLKDSTTSVVQTAAGKINKMYDEGRNLLIINDFDDVSSLIAMKGSVVAKVRPQELFEGFFASSSMYGDWMNPIDFFNRRSDVGVN